MPEASIVFPVQVNRNHINASNTVRAVDGCVSITSSRNGAVGRAFKKFRSGDRTDQPEPIGLIYDVCESLVVIPLNWH